MLQNKGRAMNNLEVQVKKKRYGHRQGLEAWPEETPYQCSLGKDARAFGPKEAKCLSS